MITQCEIRKLYNRKSEPGASDAIEMAKTFERRRCGHHPDEYPEPLSTNECMSSVVDPKQNGENKHRYVVASQAQDVRRMLRGVRAVPLIYIKRSVMILEPMADEAVQVRAREERAKFRAELKQPAQLGKRKREGEDEEKAEPAAEDAPKKKKKNYAPGAKQPNPLSVKKAKKKEDKPQESPKKETTTTKETEQDDKKEDDNDDAEAKKPRKRKRGKRKPKTTDANGDATPADGGDNEADDE